MTWRYFAGACVLAGGLLFKAGAPVPAILLGMAGAAGFNWWRLSRH